MLRFTEFLLTIPLRENYFIHGIPSETSPLMALKVVTGLGKIEKTVYFQSQGSYSI